MRALRILPFLLALATFAAVPIPTEKEQWTVRSAGEFTIYSNASDSVTADIARDLLRMREALGKVTRLNTRSPLPMHVFVFRNQRVMAPFGDALFGKADAQISGGFLPTRHANYIVVDAGPERRVDRVVYHELAHFFLRNTIPVLPVWLDEGLAEYYSTFGIAGDHRDRVRIGRPIPEHVLTLRRSRLIPFDRYFAIDQKSPEYIEGPRRQVFYAQSWALMHYLLSGGETRRQTLNEYFTTLTTPRPKGSPMPPLNVDAADLEHEIRSYLQRPGMAFIEYKLSELVIPEPSEAAQLKHDELLFALGSLLAWNRGTHTDGEAFLREAIRVNPMHAEAHATLGYLSRRRGDAAGARAFFEKAIALGSRDAGVYVIAGRDMLEGANDFARARQLFERASQLDPNDARAWAGLGATYVGDPGDPSVGIRALERSLALAPMQIDVSVNLIQLCAESGREADVQRLHDEIVATSTDDTHRRIARESLQFVRVRSAERLFAEGKRAEAVARMRDILARTSDEELQDHLRGVIGSFEEETSPEEQSETIRAILARASAGEAKEALAMLDNLLPRVTDEAIRVQLEELRKQLVRSR